MDHRTGIGVKPTESTPPAHSDIDVYARLAQWRAAEVEALRQLDRRIAALEATVAALTEIPRSLVPTAKAAKHCGCAPKTLLKAVKQGELQPASYKGNRPLFSYAELDRYNAAKAVAKARRSEQPARQPRQPTTVDPRVTEGFRKLR
ncbi:MAG TPA: hypothetical protein VIJ33_07955 [Solirubrobacteraceae bacterium]